MTSALTRGNKIFKGNRETNILEWLDQLMMTTQQVSRSYCLEWANFLFIDNKKRNTKTNLFFFSPSNESNIFGGEIEQWSVLSFPHLPHKAAQKSQYQDFLASQQPQSNPFLKPERLWCRVTSVCVKVNGNNVLDTLRCSISELGA